MTETDIRIRRWSRVEYERLVEKGVFLPGERLEVRRDPAPSDAAPFGFRYDTVTTLPAAATAYPLAAPGAVIAVADLLP